MKEKNGRDMVLPSNKKIIIALIVILTPIIIIAATGYYYFQKSNSRAARYFHTLKDVKDIKDIYQEQIAIWRTMAAYKGDDKILREAYYKFSKKSDIIQDKYFNLRMKFIDDHESHIAEKIEKIKSFHQKTSEKYISVIFENSAAFLPYDQSVLMRDDEIKIFDELDYISKEIMLLASKEISKSSSYYFVFFVFLAVLVIISVFIVILIVRVK